jgi:predicted amidohydrolase YtcJ
LTRRFTRRDFLAASAAAATTLALGGPALSDDAQSGARGAEAADTILRNGRIATQDARRSFAQALAIRDGRFASVGDEKSVMALRGPDTRIVDLGGRTVIPGLNDSHIHLIRDGLLARPQLDPDAQALSTRRFMRELNRFGLTSIIDAGGGFLSYPDDYRVVEQLHRDDLLTLRVAYNLSAQNPGHELEDFERWTRMTAPHQGDDFYRMNGAGELLVFSADDFEDFLEPRPDLPKEMEAQLRHVVRLLAKNRWPFRMRATYDESIARFLDVFEDVNRDLPFEGLRWFFDHAETISDRNIERVHALGGGIAVQDRMAFQGESFADRYGKEAAAHTPPISKMLAAGIPVGAGTDATGASSYNPWVSLHWLVTGRTVGGASLRPEANRLDRMEALRLYTQGSAWFSGEEEKKGAIVPGRLADLAVLSADYFAIPEDEIPRIESVLTLVGGRLVYGAGPFAALALASTEGDSA